MENLTKMVLEKIHLILLDKPMTLGKLAEKLDISRITLGKLINHKTNAQKLTVYKIEKYFFDNNLDAKYRSIADRFGLPFDNMTPDDWSKLKVLVAQERGLGIRVAE